MKFVFGFRETGGKSKSEARQAMKQKITQYNIGSRQSQW
jgi:hypothetical protein